MLLGWVTYREHIGRRVKVALFEGTLGGALASGWHGEGGSILGVLGMGGATLAWAADKTLTRRLADVRPLDVVTAKAAFGALVTATLALASGATWPAATDALGLLVAGAFGYGVGLELYLRAQRLIGAARTGSVFAVAPFLGAAVGLVLEGKTLTSPKAIFTDAIPARAPAHTSHINASSHNRGSHVSVTIELLLIVLLSIANGLFAAAEIAVLSVRKSRLTELVAAGDRKAARVQALRKDPERFLATVQIGITVIGAGAAAFGGATLSRRLAAFLLASGMTKYTEETAVVIVVLLVSYLSLVLGELVPKSLALRGAERYSLFVAGPLVQLARAARPLVWLLTVSSNAVLRLFGDRTSFTEARLSADELKQLVEDAADEGTLEPIAGEIAARAIGFGELQVEAVMIPRSSVRAIPATTGAADVHGIVDTLLDDRIVVHGEADDDIGYLTLRDLLTLAKCPDKTARDLVHPPHYVPTTALAVDVLRQMQAQRCHLAFVVDEQGTVVGIATLEEMVEEVVGDIFAEHQSAIAGIEVEGEGVAKVLGSIAIHHVNRTLGLDLPGGPEWTTVAGLVLAKTGEIPKRGTTIHLDGGIAIEVLEASARRVQAVRVTWVPKPPKGG